MTTTADPSIAAWAGLALPHQLSAQSANIDMVSGATYTSDGYIRSLQNAIDQATS